MTRRLALAALWVAATVVAILMVSFAVRLVGNNVVAEGPATVTRGQVEADLSTIPGSTVPDAAPAAEATLPESDATAPSTVVGPSVVPTPTPLAPSTTSPPGGVDPPVVVPAGDDSVPQTTAPAAVPTTAPAAVEQSFPLVGGSVRIRCAGGAASLVSSSPNPGYAMEVRSIGPERVEVRFAGADHTSELKAWCSAGSIVAEPKESGQGDGGHG